METFVGDLITIQMLTGITLTGAQCAIKFRRPDGTVGFWSATIDPLDATIMYYETDSNDLNLSGEWKLQAFVESPTLRGHGKICDLTVNKPLTDRESETTVAPTTGVL